MLKMAATLPEKRLALLNQFHNVETRLASAQERVKAAEAAQQRALAIAGSELGTARREWDKLANEYEDVKARLRSTFDEMAECTPPKEQLTSEATAVAPS